MSAETTTERLYDTRRDELQQLEVRFKYSGARELLHELKRRDPTDVRIDQRLARNTYKDEDLVPATRFETALELLRGIGLEDPQRAQRDGVPESSFPETFGLAGAIFKRMWELGGQLEPLERALFFYRKGRLASATPQDGSWCGINEAFVLEVLVARERKSIRRARGESTPKLEQLGLELGALRGQLQSDLEEFLAREGSKPTHWHLCTLAEVEFGLGRYDRVRELLARARWSERRDPNAVELSDWQSQATFKQLVTLGRIRELPLPCADEPNEASWRPWRALAPLLQRSADEVLEDRALLAALGCARGHVGLALSGGGFRASLFHLGVLARLADVDALRSVEALSTVSGGSIVGAHYYLEVRRLLQSRPDVEITREDYVKIVARVQDRFLRGVQRNLRTRVVTNLIELVKMLLPWTRTSRSSRIGDLYERELYSQVGEAPPGHRAPPPDSLRMRELTIEPPPAPGASPQSGFKPKFDNWRRQARVPTLLLNATTLNSGHSWQFTARWMGEPPGLVDAEVGANPRHRRLWYRQAPPLRRWLRKPSRELRDVSLGQAVAASACVPGLFEPLELRGLYPGRIVRLVDGGVYDNQGIRSLINEGSTLILCSDASGQMDEVTNPGNSSLAVPLRSFSILSSRTREAEYTNLRDAVENSALQGACFIHLKKDLDALPLDWSRIPRRWASKPLEHPYSATSYGIDKTVQRQLAAIRTDLDSFGEVEAYALMVSGYRMMEHELKELDRKHKADGSQGTWGEFDVHAPRSTWVFLDQRLEFLMSLPPDASDQRRKDLARQLDAGAALAFKLWKVWPAMAAATKVAGVAALAIGAYWLVENWGGTFEIAAQSFSYGAVTLTLALTLGALVVPIVRWLRPTQAMQAYLLKTVLATFGWVAAWTHLRTTDWMYLRLTRLQRLLDK